MSDQPNNDQPKLSIEEELDVLEAVYKIGKEKGLDLLRPEQLRKLTEAGRVRSRDVHLKASRIAENVTKQLLARIDRNQSPVVNMDERKKLFEKVYGTDPAHFYLNLEHQLSQVRSNG